MKGTFHNGKESSASFVSRIRPFPNNAKKVQSMATSQYHIIVVKSCSVKDRVSGSLCTYCTLSLS